VGLWICESKVRKRCLQTTKQGIKLRQGYPGQSIEAAIKEQHDEDEEGQGKMV